MLGHVVFFYRLLKDVTFSSAAELFVPLLPIRCRSFRIHVYQIFNLYNRMYQMYSGNKGKSVLTTNMTYPSMVMNFYVIDHSPLVHHLYLKSSLDEIRRLQYTVKLHLVH